MMTCRNPKCPVTVYSTASPDCPGCHVRATPSPPVLVGVEAADLLADLRRTQRQDDQASYRDGQAEAALVHSQLYEDLIVRLTKYLEKLETDGDHGFAEELRKVVWP